jgi:putative ABC transport system substrate-binding protein
LAHPGGNTTGTSNSLTDIAPKHLDLLHDALPRVSRLAVLMNSAYSSHRAALETMQALSPRIGVQIVPVDASSAEEIENAFSAMIKRSAQAVIVVTAPFFIERRWRIAELAVKNKLASIGYSSEYGDSGFLISYGPNNTELYRRTAAYVDKILKGSKPADLPVEQPTQFELVINQKTANALGVTIPKEVLLRADRVIE